MLIKQLSVFLENEPGRLLAVTEKLAENDIDICALSLADTSNFGILRMIVNKPDEAVAILKETGVIVRLTDVAVVGMDDVPGGTVKILKTISEAGLSIEYLYASVGRGSGKAFMVMRMDDMEKARFVLENSDFIRLNPADIYRL